jgi:hypothetical protein
MEGLPFSVVLCSMSKHSCNGAPRKTLYMSHSPSTQKILQHARMVESGLTKRDAVKESISLELDMLNIL